MQKIFQYDLLDEQYLDNIGIIGIFIACVI